MSVRTYKRFAALVIVLTLCVASVPAFAAQYDESGTSSGSSIGDSRSQLGILGDPDRTNGCTPPTLAKTGVVAGYVGSGDSRGSRGETLWVQLARWITGLLQRNGYRY